uniref:Putative secreted protein n=1 Tax=Anopheles darlingi TaxID=43151 RepID=A0A2M4DI96_ANODA
MHARIITTLGTRNTAGIFLLFHYTARAAAAAAAVTIYYNAAPLLLRSSSAARNTEILRVVAETSRGRGVGAGGGPELWWRADPCAQTWWSSARQGERMAVPRN